MNEYNNELYHFGVKGMRWGVRRYQNYDGSYTKRGLARFNIASDRYDRNKATYKKAKSDYKSGLTDKSSVKRAKSDVKYAKKRMKQAYSSLKLDKKADEGKNLYRSGKTITGNGASLAYMGIGLVATKAARDYLAANGNEKYANIATAAGTALGMAYVGKQLQNRYENNRLRAYYAGGGKYRENGK